MSLEQNIVPTIEELIAKYHALTDYMDKEQAAFDARLKPWKDGAKGIKAFLMSELNRQGVRNFKTDAGTAYLSTTMGVKVDNRDAWLQFVQDNNQWGMLECYAYKKPIEDWLEANQGVLPPGIAVSYDTKCNINRSK